MQHGSALHVDRSLKKGTVDSCGSFAGAHGAEDRTKRAKRTYLFIAQANQPLRAESTELTWSSSEEGEKVGRKVGRTWGKHEQEWCVIIEYGPMRR